MMAYKTLMLQIYKPSRRKQMMMDKALFNYGHALQFLLTTLKDAVQKLEISEKQVSKGMLLSLVDKKISKELNDFNVQPFKDSLKMDFAVTMATYLAQKQKNKNTGYPKLLENAHKTHPIYFGRYAPNRDYCLLYDEYTGRFYAKLYLLNFAQRIFYYAKASRLSLRYVSSQSSYLLNQTGSQRYLIMPLAMGNNQYTDLKKALDHPEILCTARLTKKHHKYYLMVNIECANEPSQQTETTLGVARDAKGGLHYTVCAANGKKLTSGSLYSDQVSQNIFILAGQVVKLALKYKSTVIVEADGGKDDKVSCGCNDFQQPLTTLQYRKLISILDYKLPEKKLPRPIKVSPHALYHTCPNCGNRAKKNCLNSKIFACVACGFATKLENIGSLDLARRLIKYEKDQVLIDMRDTSDGRQNTGMWMR